MAHLLYREIRNRRPPVVLPAPSAILSPPCLTKRTARGKEEVTRSTAFTFAGASIFSRLSPLFLAALFVRFPPFQRLFCLQRGRRGIKTSRKFQQPEGLDAHHPANPLRSQPTRKGPLHRLLDRARRVVTEISLSSLD